MAVRGIVPVAGIAPIESAGAYQLAHTGGRYEFKFIPGVIHGHASPCAQTKTPNQNKTNRGPQKQGAATQEGDLNSTSEKFVRESRVELCKDKSQHHNSQMYASYH